MAWQARSTALRAAASACFKGAQTHGDTVESTSPLYLSNVMYCRSGLS